MNETVAVTGATGYIARHVIVQLLDAGYTVRGTARSAASLDKLKVDLTPRLRDQASVERLSVVAADLLSDAGWSQAVAGCTFVHHVASPIPSAPPKDENELITPAKEGTLRVLRASLEAGVSRVILTSSLAAVLYGVDRNKTFTEADWSNPSDKRIGAYEKSKTIAERAAWDFMASVAPEAMTLTAINPGGVLGPMYGDAMSTSNELVKKLMERAFPACPDLTYSMVDVRDVAEAHVRAMTAPDAAGQRYLCGIENHSMRDVAAILDQHYSSKGYKIPTGKLPNVMLKLVAKFDKTVALALNDLSRPHHIDNAKVTALLGRPLRGLEEMTLAMAESLIEYSLVKPKK
jgi:dihydroflavonol-4-reductase